MKVKIFQGWGHAQVQKLERDINEWLEILHDKGGVVQHTNVTSAGTGTSQPGDEIVQAVTVTVWYDDH